MAHIARHHSLLKRTKTSYFYQVAACLQQIVPLMISTLYSFLPLSVIFAHEAI